MIRTRHSFKQKKGQTLVEYALILAFVSVVAISALISLGQKINSAYSSIDGNLATAQNGGSSSGGGTPPSNGGNGGNSGDRGRRDR